MQLVYQVFCYLLGRPAAMNPVIQIQSDLPIFWFRSDLPISPVPVAAIEKSKEICPIQVGMDERGTSLRMRRKSRNPPSKDSSGLREKAKEALLMGPWLDLLA